MRENGRLPGGREQVWRGNRRGEHPLKTVTGFAPSRRWRLTAALIGLAGGLHAATQTHSTTLAFGVQDHSMWGSGAGYSMDESWEGMLVDFKHMLSERHVIDLPGDNPMFNGLAFAEGRVGLVPTLKINSGTADIAYPLRLDAVVPESVAPGETIFLDTSKFALEQPSMTTSGPTARFTLDAVFELDRLTVAGAFAKMIDDSELNTVDMVSMMGHDAFRLSSDGVRQTIVDIGPESASLTLDTGIWGEVEIGLPEQLQTATATGLGTGTPLQYLASSAQAEDNFFNVNVDLISILLNFVPPAQLAHQVLNGEWVLLGELTPEGAEEKPIFSIKYTTLGAQLNAGLKFAQDFRFCPTSVDVSVNAYVEGESAPFASRTGPLGAVFEFAPPASGGNVELKADFTLSGKLRNRTGFIPNVALDLTALGAVVKNTWVSPHFELNLADDVFGLDREHLFQQTYGYPPANAAGHAYYLFDREFDVTGFQPQSATYEIAVTPAADPVDPPTVPPPPEPAAPPTERSPVTTPVIGPVFISPAPGFHGPEVLWPAVAPSVVSTDAHVAAIPAGLLLGAPGYSYTVTAASLDPHLIEWYADREFEWAGDPLCTPRVFGDTVLTLIPAGPGPANTGYLYFYVAGLVDGLPMVAFGEDLELDPGVILTEPLVWDSSTLTQVFAGAHTLELVSGVLWLPSQVGDVLTVSSEYGFTVHFIPEPACGLTALCVALASVAVRFRRP